MTEVHEFTLHASHELKTPLAILHAQIETALASAKSTVDKERFADQLEEIQRLARIVEALNLLARSNSGQMKYNKTPLPLHTVVLDTLEDATILARAQGISVKVEVGSETWIVGDRDRLRQMLLNLMENAIKYNESGGEVNVSLSTGQTAATLEISNTGKGVSKKDLPHVFDKFYRGSCDRNGDPGGAGLGLSIVRSIVLAHGGEIKFDSTRGGLTTVRITLPTIEKPTETFRDAGSALAV
jgi:signal transduction histidine kinase